MPGTGAIDAVDQLISQGRLSEAAHALRAAAEQHDADALFKLAAWRLSGKIIPRDVRAARSLMGDAAEAGHGLAALYFAHFMANGTGGAPQWRRALEIVQSLSSHDPTAAKQVAMLERMPVDENGEPTRLPALEELRSSPLVQCARAFLSSDECAYLIELSEPRLQPSVVVDRATGRAFPHPDRKSDGAFFGVVDEDLVVNALNRRIAAISETRPEQAEPLQILRYGPGGEFKPHFDVVKEAGNQRILTAIIYLTDAYSGGETRFMRTGLSFRGNVGDLLLLSNVTPEGLPDWSAEHAGMPVLEGTKIIASRWIWREPYSVPPPRPAVAHF